MKMKILSLVLCLLSVHAYGQENLISNGDFEAWGATTPVDGSPGVSESTPADWTFSQGNGNMSKLYQYSQAQSGDYSVILRNTIATASSRIISPQTSALEAGTYKLTFWIRGKATLQNVTLNGESSINGNTALNPTSKNLFPNGGTSPLDDALDLGTVWTKKEYLYTVTVAGQYKLVFFVLGCGGLDGSADNYFLLDDVVLVEYQDPVLSELKVRNNSVPGFSPQTLSYTVPLQSNYASTYNVTATAANILHTVDITQAAGLTGSESERTATVVVTAGSETKTYTVVFSKTAERIREGFASDAFYSPWADTDKTWYFDATAGRNNGIFLGDKSIRPVASGVTEAIFTVSNLADAGTLSFYIMSRNEGATLYVEYQAIGASGWTVLKTVEDNYTAYTQLTCDIKQNTPVNIRFRVTKDDGKSGYQLDDISISAYTPPTGIASPSPGKQHIASDGKAIRLTADGAASFRIMSAAGQAVRAGNFEGERQIASLPPGIYLVKLTTAVGASVRKVAIR